MSQPTYETWHPVVGYEGSYEVSSHYRVRSVDRQVLGPRGRTHNRKGKILTLWSNGRSVILARAGKNKTRSVAQLAAAAGAVSGESECATCGKQFHHRLINSARATYCSTDCKPRCSIPGCTSPSRKRGWCSAHHEVWRRTGDPTTPLVNPWATTWVCVVCGVDVEKNSGRRKHCSRNCQVLDSRLKGNVPKMASCALCGDDIDLFARNYNGRKKRTDTRLCNTCGSVNSREWSVHLATILDRDNHTCGICSTHIDLTHKYPHPQSATVDHILPRSLGGTNTLDNLQPSHAVCNSTKQDRIGFTIR